MGLAEMLVFGWVQVVLAAIFLIAIFAISFVVRKVVRDELKRSRISIS